MILATSEVHLVDRIRKHPSQRARLPRAEPLSRRITPVCHRDEGERACVVAIGTESTRNGCIFNKTKAREGGRLPDWKTRHMEHSRTPSRCTFAMGNRLWVVVFSYSSMGKLGESLSVYLVVYVRCPNPWSRSKDFEGDIEGGDAQRAVMHVITGVLGMCLTILPLQPPQRHQFIQRSLLGRGFWVTEVNFMEPLCVTIYLGT